MINKIVTTDSYTHDQPTVSVVPAYSRGFDVAHWQKKYASEMPFAKTLSELKPVPGETVLHLIALGDGEIYGSNRNFDYFSKKANSENHRTFVDLAKLYKDHKSGPNLEVGRVIDSVHNDPMSRVELLVGLDNGKLHKEVQQVESGKDLPFSMGAAVDFDVCSACGNKAPTAKDHCDCIKNHAGEVLADGTKIAMVNPDPKFFDISIVWKPADRIAYMLKKVASGYNKPVTGADLAEQYGLNAVDQIKLAEMRRIASMIKLVPAGVAKTSRPISVRADTKRELKEAAAAYGADQVIGQLRKQGMLLSAEDFADIVVQHNMPYLCKLAEDDLPVNLNELLDDHAQVGSFEPTIAQYQIKLSAAAQHDLRESCSMDPSAVLRRTLMVSIAAPHVKIAQIIDRNEAQGLVDLYRHYKLAFMRQNLSSRQLVQSVAATF